MQSWKNLHFKSTKLQKFQKLLLEMERGNEFQDFKIILKKEKLVEFFAKKIKRNKNNFTMIITILSKYLDPILFMTNLCHLYTKHTLSRAKIVKLAVPYKHLR